MTNPPLSLHVPKRPLLTVLAVLAALVAPFLVNGTDPAAASVTPGSVWLTDAELSSLPTSGPAWESLVDDARGDWGTADVADQNSDHDIDVFAAALVAERTDDAGLRGRVAEALADVPGTESGGRTLALGRNLVGYVLAADMIGYRDPAFVRWVDEVRTRDLSGRTLIDTHEDRPNNWGTHAGASRIAAAMYLGDTEDLRRSADVFAGWVGDRSRYDGFEYGDLDWQCDPSKPVGINPAGCTIDGKDVDGVIPDDQRRGGGFTWPPPAENYVWEALQGAVVQAHLLHRAGYDAWAWSDQAVVRAMRWLHEHPDYPAEGDDTWMPWLVNHAVGTDFPTRSATSPGKNLGYTDWSHAERGAAGAPGVATGAQPPQEEAPAPPPRDDLEVSERRFEAGEARHAVLGRDDLFVDSLAGSALTDAGPMLFTGPDTLDDATAKELERVLEPGRTVYLLGGPKAMSPAVEKAVADLGLEPRRLGGADRIETALLVADEVRSVNGGGQLVAIARSNGPASAAWVDAATAGGWAAAAGHPVVVTPTNELDGRVREWLDATSPSRVVLLGGRDALSGRVEEAVGDAVRLDGRTRADTAARIATSLWGNDRRSGHFTVVDGWSPNAWQSAFAAAGVAADKDAPMLLVDPNASNQAESTQRVSGACDGKVTLHAVGMSRDEAAEILKRGC